MRSAMAAIGIGIGFHVGKSGPCAPEQVTVKNR